jgi:hypothetical protein
MRLAEGWSAARRQAREADGDGGAAWAVPSYACSRVRARAVPTYACNRARVQVVPLVRAAGVYQSFFC